MDKELRNFWGSYFTFNWKFGVFLLLLLGIPRFLLVLRANETGNYGVIGLVMVLSAITPFLFLNKNGRNKIGIKGTTKLSILGYAFGVGIVSSLLLYVLGVGLYGQTYENWYAYIGKSYAIPEGLIASERNILFTIMAVTGMTFSPIGEEFFFRGMVQGSFAKSLGNQGASVIDGLMFALVHLSHFGLVFVNGSWQFYVVPGCIWVVSMFLVSLLFFQMKNRAHSIWGAVCCHAGFNLGMIYAIFYLM